MVTIDKIEHGVAAYLDSELMPKIAGNQFEKVVAGTAVSLLIRRGGNMIANATNSSTIKMLGIVDEAGNIDIDAVYEEMKKNMPTEGPVKVELPIIGVLSFNKDDLDKLYEYITNSVKGA